MEQHRLSDSSPKTSPFSSAEACLVHLPLVRLRSYYPDDYQRLKAGELKKQIAEFESDEEKPD